MKTKIALLLLIPTLGFSQIKILDKIKKTVPSTSTSNALASLSSGDISQGLKEALNKGIEKQVTKLTAVDGFYKNEMVKILLPEEAQPVYNTINSLPGGNLLLENAVLSINRAAEDAALCSARWRAPARGPAVAAHDWRCAHQGAGQERD
jgi:hypothetical protein